MKRALMLVALAVLLAGCGGAEPTPTPDLVATQIAVEKAAHATMTAEAPAATDTPLPTDTATPTPTAAPTSTPTATWTPTITWTSTLIPTAPSTETPMPTFTAIPTKEPKPEPTNTPQVGKVLLFASTESSENDLFTIDKQGGNRKKLTTVGKIGTARYSPNGKRIAFDRHEGETPVNNWDIYIMRADGSNIVNVTQTHDWVEFDPDWSPDGSRIVFRGRPSVEEYSKVYIMNADGSGRALLTDANNSNRYPSWSPNGRKIAFVGYWEGGGGYWKDKGDIFTIGVDGSGLTNVTNRGEGFASPVWSPDGTELIFGRLTRDPSTGEHWQVWRMNADGGSQRCIIGCIGEFSKFSNVPVAWRGSRIAFRGWEGGDWDVFIANSDGTGIVQLTNKEADEKTKDWQP